ncbi:MAG TPA: hypothetical protein VMW64_03385, partial [Dehalococcoidia bacterium]|nr:hypothetical protein [Dehalococcoidia bacterium]
MVINPVLIALFAVVIVAFLLFVIYRVVEAYRRQASTSREEVPIIFLTNFFLFALYKAVVARRRQSSTVPDEVPITLLPKTSLGRWSLGLAIAFIMLFTVAAVPLGDQWGLKENEEVVNPVLTVILTIILFGIAVATLVTGFIGAIKHKERSILVFLG